MLPVIPKEGLKTQIGRFGNNTALLWKKYATNFLCTITISGKVVRHSLAYLIVQEWLVGDVPCYLKFCAGWLKL